MTKQSVANSCAEPEHKPVMAEARVEAIARKLYELDVEADKRSSALEGRIPLEKYADPWEPYSGGARQLRRYRLNALNIIAADPLTLLAHDMAEALAFIGKCINATDGKVLLYQDSCVGKIASCTSAYEKVVGGKS